MDTFLEYPGLKSFDEPVTIKCQVNEKKLIAEILGRLDNPIQYSFLIKFSDGVIIEATFTEYGNLFLNEVKYRHYLLAIENSLRDFSCVSFEDWYKFEIQNGKIPLLVWVGNWDSSNKYSVHFNGDYQFHLIQTKTGWENKSVRIGAGPVDQHIVSLVVRELEKKIVDAKSKAI